MDQHIETALDLRQGRTRITLEYSFTSAVPLQLEPLPGESEEDHYERQMLYYLEQAGIQIQTAGCSISSAVIQPPTGADIQLRISTRHEIVDGAGQIHSALDCDPTIQEMS